MLCLNRLALRCICQGHSIVFISSLVELSISARLKLNWRVVQFVQSGRTSVVIDSLKQLYNNIVIHFAIFNRLKTWFGLHAKATTNNRIASELLHQTIH